MRNEIPNDERLMLLNQIDSYGASLLHYVTALDYYELIPILFEHQADINIRSSSCLTPLVIAAAKGYEKSVKKLIRYGAVLIRDKDYLEKDSSL